MVVLTQNRVVLFHVGDSFGSFQNIHCNEMRQLYCEEILTFDSLKTATVRCRKLDRTCISWFATRKSLFGSFSRCVGVVGAQIEAEQRHRDVVGTSTARTTPATHRVSHSQCVDAAYRLRLIPGCSCSTLTPCDAALGHASRRPTSSQ